MTQQGNAVARVEPKRSLIAKMAEERGVESADFYKTVTETMFKGANQSQLMTLLLVADRYHLDVTTKEIYAFPAKGGGIVPVVSIDGWISLAHQHPAYDGEEFRYADKLVTPQGAKACPEWMEIVIYRKDTSHPTVIREYLEECFRGTDPWKSHTKRMLRHKTMIQGYRVAFGFSGIKDEDEAQRIAIEGTGAPAPPEPTGNAARAAQALGGTPTTTAAPKAPEPAPVAADEAPVEEPPVDIDPVTGEVIDEAEPEAPEDDGPVEEGEVVEEEQKLSPRATRQQVATIRQARKKSGVPDDDFDRLLAGYGVEDETQLTRDEAMELIRFLAATPGSNG